MLDNVLMYVVIIAYIFMVICNIVAGVQFQDAATDGYAYSYLQPNNTTFSVWGLIYCLQILFLFAQTCIPHIRDHPQVINARPGIIACFLLNASWLIVNGMANEDYLLSYWSAVSVLIANVVYLYFGVYRVVTKNYGINDDNEDNDWSERFFIWKSKRHALYRLLVIYPFSTNLAWIVLASILNLTNTVFNYEYLQKQPTAVGGPDYAIGIAVAASIIAVHFTVTNNDLGYGLVVIWALNGIRNNQTQEISDMPSEQPQSQKLADAASFGMVIVSLGIVLGYIIKIVKFFDWKKVSEAKLHMKTKEYHQQEEKVKITKSLMGI